MIYLDDVIKRARALSGHMGLFESVLDDILTQALTPDVSLDIQIDLDHRIQRLEQIQTAGLTNNVLFKTELENLSPPTWRNFESLNAPLIKQKMVADRLYLGREQKNGLTLLRLDRYSKMIAHTVIESHLKDDAPFLIMFGDSDFNTLVINHAPEHHVEALAQSFLNRVDKVTASTAIRESGSPSRIQKNKTKHDLFAKIVRPYGERTMSGQIRWVLTVIPSVFDAERDDIPHDEYTSHYLEMCDQPLDYDDTPHKELIKALNTASELRFTNRDGTDVSMSLIDHDGKHFTFCNSTHKRNVPGSEVFSAPRRDSVQGIVVARGKHPLRGESTKTIRDLTLWFDQGRIIKFKTASTEEDALFQSHLDRDPNNYYIGEIGIGTNPYLKAHIANTLLVEKIGGQFHLALGGCYTMTDYVGDPVHVNNGNHTANGDHWDIATMLYGREGRIYLDGRLIMDHGRFLEPQYAVLNDGWAAVPMDKRPAHRQNLLTFPLRFEREIESS
ncbi:MAG: aminopeptidase [Alphaproteobacteria bacterium]|nr:aminopeptidase [Alphaproteobacteria bacterium]